MSVKTYLKCNVKPLSCPLSPPGQFAPQGKIYRKYRNAEWLLRTMNIRVSQDGILYERAADGLYRGLRPARLGSLPNEVKFLMPSRYEAIDQHTVFPGGYLLVKPDMTNRDGDFLQPWREIE
mgnify:CR=1 FL=1